MAGILWEDHFILICHILGPRMTMNTLNKRILVKMNAHFMKQKKNKFKIRNNFKQLHLGLEYWTTSFEKVVQYSNHKKLSSIPTLSVSIFKIEFITH